MSRGSRSSVPGNKALELEQKALLPQLGEGVPQKGRNLVSLGLNLLNSRILSAGFSPGFAGLIPFPPNKLREETLCILCAGSFPLGSQRDLCIVDMAEGSAGSCM